jgi:hypothetical protein
LLDPKGDQLGRNATIVKSMVTVDFFTVPTVRFQMLYVFLVLAHDPRRLLHFGVTAHPTAEWTAQQLREAFPWDSAPRFLLRDRDCIFGADFTRQVKEFGIQEVLGALRAPRQRAYIERVIGTIRRECLDHMIVFNEASLRRQMTFFLANSFVARKGHAGESFGTVAGVGASGSGAAGWRAAPSVRTSSCLTARGRREATLQQTPPLRIHREPFSPTEPANPETCFERSKRYLRRSGVSTLTISAPLSNRACRVCWIGKPVVL